MMRKVANRASGDNTQEPTQSQRHRLVLALGKEPATKLPDEMKIGNASQVLQRVGWLRLTRTPQ